MQKDNSFPRWNALLKEVLGDDQKQKTDDKKPRRKASKKFRSDEDSKGV